ncbi:formate/nitrite transporter family protein [Roseovarius sp. B08]|uniref:formate/nitrite transporter family protein n=1 Tax=Roseovarius sp. B08 TaxID=3449223 RepID=UPI003EDC9D5C
MAEQKNDDLIKQEKEKEAIEEAAALSPRLIFESIRRNGEEELERPKTALWFSGMAAGMLISFSVLAEALLRAHLPEAEWRYIIENFGYSLGFVLVILGRLQLFTENTITTVVPVMLDPCKHTISRTAILWSTVLAANVIGAFAVGTFFAFGGVLSDPVATAFTDLSRHATGIPAFEGFMRGIPAGVLIAAIVWMLPSAKQNEMGVIVIFTWLIALGDFTHVIAGSVEMAYLVVQGQLGISPAAFGFFLPVLLGNIMGGTLIFTVLTYAQVMPEVE